MNDWSYNFTITESRFFRKLYFQNRKKILEKIHAYFEKSNNRFDIKKLGI